MNTPLKIARRGATIELTLNRPERRNALSRALIAELTDRLRQADMEPEVRCVIITGAPPAFCAGLDLNEIAEVASEQATHDASALLTLYETIDNLGKPVIAAVNGPAVAGGAGLITVCDIVILGSSAFASYPEIKRGLVAAIVMVYLRRLVGDRHAKHLLLTGEKIMSERAVQCGLASEIAPDTALLDRARYYADLIAAYPPSAVRETKRLFNEIRQMDHGAGVETARHLSATMRLTEESRAGVREFLGHSG